MPIDAHNLTDSQEWKLLMDHLRKLERDYAGEIIEHAERGEVTAMAERAGRIAMIRDFPTLPGIIFPQKESKDAS
jgi:hypothetical protein